MRKMSITPIDDAGVLRSLILIILPILGFWMLGIVLGWNGHEEETERERERERERQRETERENAGRKETVLYQQIFN